MNYTKISVRAYTHIHTYTHTNYVYDYIFFLKKNENDDVPLNSFRNNVPIERKKIRLKLLKFSYINR